MSAQPDSQASDTADTGQEVSATPALDALKTHPITTVDGRTLRVSFAVDPVLDLRASALAGHRIEARILDVERGRELTGRQRRTLLPSDFAKIDMAALERGMSRLTDADAEGPPRMIVQLSFASLSNSRSRQALIAKTTRVQHLLKQAVICELVDIEAGLPVNRLLELNSMIRPFFRSVWLQVQPHRALVETAKAARIPGLSVRAGDLGVDPQGVANGMRAFMALVQRAAPVLSVTNLPLRELSIEAMAAGFTHATLRVQS